MFELDRLHSQALTRFSPRKLAMSLLGGAGESRTITVGKTRHNEFGDPVR
ncbi:MAG: hypothetical protein ACON5D_01300 [Rubripirellula sp.]